jgi:LysR family transcriptional regulator, glycine cleavage system transcriptional activator
MLTNMARHRLPLQTLPTFLTVARLGNLRAAADELHLTHSAISQQIRLLEEQLGFLLFDRRGRRIVLNAAGQALLASSTTALATLDEGVQAAAAAAGGSEQRLRITVIPSFAQRWLLPRMGRWRERHPDIALEVESSQRLVDLSREGFHAAVRAGRGGWAGLDELRLIDSPLIVVGAPAAALRLREHGEAALAEQPLIGEATLWAQWFAAGGIPAKPRPVADFNDAGLMLQAAEHDLGIVLARELLAAEGLLRGSLVRLSPRSIEVPDASAYFLVHPKPLADWKPLRALRGWLLEELAAVQADLAGLNRAGTAPAGPRGSRNPSPSAAPARRRAR